MPDRKTKGGYESADTPASELGPFPEVLTRPAMRSRPEPAAGPEAAFRRALADRMPRELRERIDREIQLNFVGAFDDAGAPVDGIDLAFPLIRDYLAAQAAGGG